MNFNLISREHNGKRSDFAHWILSIFSHCCKKWNRFKTILTRQAEKTSKSIKIRLSLLFLILFNFWYIECAIQSISDSGYFQHYFFLILFFFLVKNYSLQWIFPKIPYYFNFMFSTVSFHELKFLSTIFLFCSISFLVFV